MRRLLATTMAAAFCKNNTPFLQRLTERINQGGGVFILDGGTGEELFRHGVPDDRKIWSATAVVNEEYHEALRNVHRSFIQAGSDAITTNSYGITPGVGFTPKEVQKYVALSARLAQQSLIKEKETFVLGSISPLVESYRPDLVSDHIVGVAGYVTMIKSLLSSQSIDCILAETLSSSEEATQAIEALGQCRQDMPIMVSFTLNSSGKVRSNESVCDAIRCIVNFSEMQNVLLAGILFNCSEPEAIHIALREIYEDSHLKNLLLKKTIRLGAYANRLTPIEENWSLEESEEAQPMREISPDQYLEEVDIWVKRLGVTMVGGCCGIQPEHIDRISKHFRP